MICKLNKALKGHLKPIRFCCGVVDIAIIEYHAYQCGWPNLPDNPGNPAMQLWTAGLQCFMKQITDYPFDPSGWNSRVVLLVHMHFPGVYKALLYVYQPSGVGLDYYDEYNRSRLAGQCHNAAQSLHVSGRENACLIALIRTLTAGNGF